MDTDDELIQKWPNKAICPNPLSAFLIIISDLIELLCPGTSRSGWVGTARAWFRGAYLPVGLHDFVGAAVLIVYFGLF